MIKIICALVVAIASVFTMFPNVNTTNAASISNSIYEVSGTPNVSNPFSTCNMLRLYNTNLSWQVVKDYYSDSLDYIFNGVSFNDYQFASFGTTGNTYRYALDIGFTDYILFNRLNTFNIYTTDDIFGYSTSWVDANVTAIVTTPNGDVSVTAFVNAEYEGGFLISLYPSTDVSLTVLKVQIRYNADYIGGYDLFDYIVYGYNVSENQYSLGYDVGYTYGFDDGFDDGVLSSFNNIDENSASYQAGYTAGSNGANSLNNLFSGVLQAPVDVVLNALNFEIFGVNVSTFVLSLLTIGFIVIILKLLL